MILLLIAACLLTVALLPRYKDYTLREHRKLAKSVLEEVLLRSQDWQTTHRGRRITSLEDLGYGAAAVYVTSDGTVRGSANLSSIYRVGLTFPTTRTPDSCGLISDHAQGGFVVVAVPIQTQRIDTQCARLCLGSSGQHQTSGTENADKCWNRTP
ncbi:MAG: hypothetical protein P4L83_23195 [Nevskia sp.]|nr:hypothetical protein [Nevskia sp.]